MARLARFEDHRFIGTRDTMKVYDCDEESHWESLTIRVQEENLMSRGLIQTFAPDTLAEARSRGFR